MTSYQVYELMNAFTFEKNRLDFAIAAYPNVIDPGNYFLTHRALNFNSSVRQLNFAISNGRF